MNQSPSSSHQTTAMQRQEQQELSLFKGRWWLFSVQPRSEGEERFASGFQSIPFHHHKPAETIILSIVLSAKSLPSVLPHQRRHSHPDHPNRNTSSQQLPEQTWMPTPPETTITTSAGRTPLPPTNNNINNRPPRLLHMAHMARHSMTCRPTIARGWEREATPHRPSRRTTLCLPSRTCSRCSGTSASQTPTGSHA